MVIADRAALGQSTSLKGLEICGQVNRRDVKIGLILYFGSRARSYETKIELEAVELNARVIKIKYATNGEYHNQRKQEPLREPSELSCTQESSFVGTRNSYELLSAGEASVPQALSKFEAQKSTRTNIDINDFARSYSQISQVRTKEFPEPLALVGYLRVNFSNKKHPSVAKATTEV